MSSIGGLNLTGLVPSTENALQAVNRDEQYLRVLATQAAEEAHKRLSDQEDSVELSDEAHRVQQVKDQAKDQQKNQEQNERKDDDGDEKTPHLDITL